MSSISSVLCSVNWSCCCRCCWCAWYFCCHSCCNRKHLINFNSLEMVRRSTNLQYIWLGIGISIGCVISLKCVLMWLRRSLANSNSSDSMSICSRRSCKRTYSIGSQSTMNKFCMHEAWFSLCTRRSSKNLQYNKTQKQKQSNRNSPQTFKLDMFDWTNENSKSFTSSVQQQHYPVHVMKYSIQYRTFPLQINHRFSHVIIFPNCCNQCDCCFYDE